jgi:hypothetical protein
MAAPLETCTKEEQRCVIRFLISEGVKPTEIHCRMKAKYGDACLSQQQVYEWSRKFTNGVISGDETWIHYHIPETKRAIVEWRHSSSPKPKNFRTQPPAGKVMLILFWDQKVVILEHYTPRGNTVTSASYSDLLKNHLRPAI